MAMKFPKKKVFNFLWMRKYVDIGLLRPATLPQVISEVMDISLLRPSTLPLIIAEDVLVEVDLRHKRQANLPLTIGEQSLILKGYVDIGLRPAIIPLITKATIIYF